MIEYALVADQGDGAPDLGPRMFFMQYSGGHLCGECAAVVREALKARRASLESAQVALKPPPRKARIKH